MDDSEALYDLPDQSLNITETLYITGHRKHFGSGLFLDGLSRLRQKRFTSCAQDDSSAFLRQ